MSVTSTIRQIRDYFMDPRANGFDGEDYATATVWDVDAYAPGVLHWEDVNTLTRAIDQDTDVDVLELGGAPVAWRAEYMDTDVDDDTADPRPVWMVVPHAESIVLEAAREAGVQVLRTA